MSSRSSKAWHGALVEIAENIDFAKQFTKGLDVATFSGDLRTVYAVTRCLEIISEAVRRLPKDITTRHADVPWEKIKAAGNIYRHEYDNVSPEILWTTVAEALHAIEQAVKAELNASKR